MAAKSPDFDHFRAELPNTYIFGSSPRRDKPTRSPQDRMAEDLVCVKYGEEENFRIYNYETNRAMDQSPPHGPPASKGLDDPFEISPTSKMSTAPVEAEDSTLVSDLLYRSPRLGRRAAREQLRPAETEEQTASTAAFVLPEVSDDSPVGIPNVETRLLDALPPRVRTSYLNWAVAHAKKNNEGLGTPLMIHVDGRPPAAFGIEAINVSGAIEHWMEKELSDSLVRAPFVSNPSAGRYKISDHAMKELGDVEHEILMLEEEIEWKKEHSRLYNLAMKLDSGPPPTELEKRRAHARDLKGTAFGLPIKSKNRLRELEAMEVIRKEVVGAVRLERANEKARQILGTGHLPYTEDFNPVEKKGKKHKPRLSILTGSKNRLSRSLTDMTTSAITQQLKARRSTDVLNNFTWDATAQDEPRPFGSSEIQVSPHSKSVVPSPPPKDIEAMTPKPRMQSTPGLTTPKKLTRKRSSSLNDTLALENTEISQPFGFTHLHSGTDRIEEKPEQVSIASSDYSGDETPVREARRMQMVLEKRTPTLKEIQAGSPVAARKLLDRNQAKKNVESAEKAMSEAMDKRRQTKRAADKMYSFDSKYDQANRNYEEAVADHEKAIQKKEEADKELIAAYQTGGTKRSPGSPEKKGSDPFQQGRSDAKLITSTGEILDAADEASNLTQSEQRAIVNERTTHQASFLSLSESADAKEGLNDVSNITPKAAGASITRPQAPKPIVLAGMTMLEKMEALKRAAPSPSTGSARRSSAITTPSPIKRTQNPHPSPPDKYDPFAAMPAFSLKPVTKETALHSHAPTEDERAFARALTRRNRIAKTKVELQSPSKAVFEEEGEWRPKTAPEAFGRGK